MVHVPSQQVRQQLAAFGTCHPQPAAQWSGTIPLPTVVADFYLEIGPTDLDVPMVGNDVYLPSLSELWNLQAGYRWNARTGHHSENWDDGWLVVAATGGDPFILDIATGTVLHAIHGTGRWTPTGFAQDLNSFAAAIGAIGSMMLDPDTIYDDDYEIRADWQAAMLRKLTDLLGDDAAAKSAISSLGLTS
ncbi:MAG: hypothetical protein AAFV19_17790 [Pseudomonadota bacterium]